MLPSVRQLQYFVATASAGQISRAAAIMNVTQSSITIAIKGLEDCLGYKLLHRHSQGVQLTSRGEIFFQNARGVLLTLETLMDVSPIAAEDFAGSVKLGLTYTVSGYFLPGLMSQIKRELPKLKIELIELPRAQIEDKILKGEIDVGVVLVSDMKDRTDFETITLLKSTRNLWVGATHRLADKTQVSFKDIADEPYIVLDADDHEETMKKNWDKYGFEPKIILRSRSMEAVRSLVAAGYGISILSDMVHRSWSHEAQRILKKRLVEDVSKLETGAIWARNRELSSSTRKLLEVMQTLPVVDLGK